MSKLEMTRDFAHPVERVFAALSDVEHEREWREEVVRTRATPPGPVRAGTLVEQTVHLPAMGDREMRFECVGFEQDRRLVFRGDIGTPITLTLLFEPRPTGCHVATTVDLEAHGLMAVAAPLILEAMRLLNGRQMSSLEKWLDRQG